RIRHLAGLELLANPADEPRHPEPAAELPPRGEQSRIPEVTPDGLSPEVLRAAILESGCLLVRGLMDRDEALRIASEIDRSFEVRLGLGAGEADPQGYYDELVPEPPLAIDQRDWIQEGGGVLAADSPRLLFDMFECFERTGMGRVIEDYLGERPAVSAQKCTLRKATPDVSGAWHQDGRFLGKVRSMNVWLSLSRCGDVAPSMDVIPRRLEEFVAAGTEGTFLSYQVSDQVAADAAGEAGIVRPVFDPGDALLFDEMFLHQTGSDPSMPNPRYAIESWFFGPSAYPEDFVPIAI
ncbi:MAG TPA: hypothetical protein VFH44_12115, partial [Solirubrobacterales bacterium]|nr:hypothetical protein [Solirubrobacterales bacterium]